MIGRKATTRGKNVEGEKSQTEMEDGNEKARMQLIEEGIRCLGRSCERRITNLAFSGAPWARAEATASRRVRDTVRLDDDMHTYARKLDVWRRSKKLAQELVKDVWHQLRSGFSRCWGRRLSSLF
jgi:hypothetical protein